jgi:hypothetical protein
VYAQDPLNGFTQRMQDWENEDLMKLKPNKGSKKRKYLEHQTKNKRGSAKDQARKSYVISKELRRGHRLIKIKIFDFTESVSEQIDLTSDDSDSEFLSVSAQYVVKNPVDEVLDSTENIINKISKEISKRHM